MSGNANYNLLLAQRKLAKRRIKIGGIMFCVGFVLTVGTFAAAAASGGIFIISWGPMLFGVIRVFIGWNALQRIDSQLDQYAVAQPQTPYTQPYGMQAQAAVPLQPAPQPAAQTAPPGWHPDPSSRHELRYWDGTSWTAHVLNNGIAQYDPA